MNHQIQPLHYHFDQLIEVSCSVSAGVIIAVNLTWSRLLSPLYKVTSDWERSTPWIVLITCTLILIDCPLANVPVIVASPSLWAVINPSVFTVAALAFVVVHVTTLLCVVSPGEIVYWTWWVWLGTKFKVVLGVVKEVIGTVTLTWAVNVKDPIVPVIVVFPPPTAVITPALLTVATLVFPETQLTTLESVVSCGS